MATYELVNIDELGERVSSSRSLELFTDDPSGNFSIVHLERNGYGQQYRLIPYP